MKIKNTFTLLALSAIVLLASCKKSNSGETPTKKLKYLTQSIYVKGTTTTFTDLTYDDQKRVKTIKGAGSIITYSYNGNYLFSIEFTAIGYREVTEYTYNNDGSISSSHDRVYRNNVLGSDIVYNYYIVNGRITESHHEIYVDKLTYDDKGNVTNIYSGQGGFNTVNTYDDKLNKYTNGFPNPNGLFFSPNNVISFTQGTQSGTTTYTYNYDSDGYPTGATADNKTLPYLNAKSTYVYTEM